LLAALTGKTGGHSKGSDSTPDAKTDTASAQNTQAPANLPSQQTAQNNQAPAPVGGQNIQGIIPDPSSLSTGSAGLSGHIITTAAQGAAASTGTSAGGTATLPQALQINQMPLPLPNMASLGIAIATRSLSGSRQFDIRLDPPELGRVDVRLSIDSTGKAQAHLSADQQQTLELLQKDSSGLARALRDAGLNVAQNGLNFSLRQHSSGGGTSHGGFSSRGARTQALSAVAALAPSPASLPSGAIPQFLTGHGRLDISV
jgi:flagellar hook-length control protein FliK